MILIVSLLKTLHVTRKPGLCATLYGCALLTNNALIDMGFGNDPKKVLALTILNTLAAWGYFYLIHETDNSSLYWVVLGAGAGLLVFILP